MLSCVKHETSFITSGPSLLDITHISITSILWDIGKQKRVDQKAQNVVSDQVLHCLLTECAFKI